MLPTRPGSLIIRALRSACESPFHQALTASVSVPSARSSAASASVSARDGSLAARPSAELVDRGEGAYAALLVGVDPVAPGLEVLVVGLEGRPQLGRLGLQGRHLVLGGGLDALQQRLAVAVEALAALHQLLALGAALAHLGEELVDREGAALQGGTDRVGVAGEPGDGVVGGLGRVAAEVGGGTVGAGPVGDVVTAVAAARTSVSTAPDASVTCSSGSVGSQAGTAIVVTGPPPGRASCRGPPTAAAAGWPARCPGR